MYQLFIGLFALGVEQAGATLRKASGIGKFVKYVTNWVGCSDSALCGAGPEGGCPCVKYWTVACLIDDGSTLREFLENDA